jgi:hypothetical protein
MIGLQPVLTCLSPVREVRVDGRHGFEYETVETFWIGSIPVPANRIRGQETDPVGHMRISAPPGGCRSRPWPASSAGSRLMSCRMA